MTDSNRTGDDASASRPPDPLTSADAAAASGSTEPAAGAANADTPPVYRSTDAGVSVDTGSASTEAADQTATYRPPASLSADSTPSTAAPPSYQPPAAFQPPPTQGGYSPGAPYGQPAPYGQQPYYQQGAPGYPPQAGWSGPPPIVETGSSALAILAGVIFVLFGGIVTLVGAFILISSSSIEQILRESGVLVGTGLTDASVAGIFVGVGIFLLVIGILQLISAVGIFGHKSWGRFLGIVVAILGVLLGLLFVSGSFSAPRTSGQGGGVIFSIVTLAGYAIALIGLIIGGDHFKQRYVQR